MSTAQALRSAAVFAISAALLAPAPAFAQGTSPSPSPSSSGVCPNVFYTFSEEDKEGPPNVPVTIEGGSDVQPAKTPDRWTATRISPGPSEVVGTVEHSPNFSFTFTVAETTTFRIEAVGPEGCGPAFADFTRTVTTSSPSPTPTPSPAHADKACPSFKVEAPRVIETGQSATITATITDDAGPAGWRLTRAAPAPAHLVAFSNRAKTTHSWSVRLGETHRFLVHAFRGQCIGGGTGTVDVLIPVRPSLTIAAVRNAPRQYTFTGRILPGRGQLVTLYRHTDMGGRVITAQSRVQSDGLYRFDRRFLGSGRFGFSVAVGNSATNLAGASSIRPTVIH